MTPSDPDYSRRLAELREHDVLGQYAGDAPASSTDPTGSVTVTIDPTNRLTGVAIGALPEELRESSALSAAVDHAFQAAILERIRLAKGPAAEANQRRRIPTARRLEKRWRPLDNILESGRPFVAPDFAAARTRRHQVVRAVRGISDNQCVAVTLDLGGSRGELEFDPGWLRQARATNIAAAITEAFTDAYQNRDGR